MTSSGDRIEKHLAANRGPPLGAYTGTVGGSDRIFVFFLNIIFCGGGVNGDNRCHWVNMKFWIMKFYMIYYYYQVE